MKTPCSFPEALFALCLISLAAPALAQTPARAATPDYGNLPLTFEVNHGQAPSSAQYVSHGQGYSFLLSPGKITIALAPAVRKSDDDSAPSILQMELVRANLHSESAAEAPQVTRSNYFLGNDPARWQTDIPNYGQVRYRAIYPGIDLVYYGNHRRLEHDFVIAPNADPAQITFTLSDHQQARLDRASGDLVLALGDREIRLLKPVSYQEEKGRRIPVASSYRLLPDHSIGFTLAAHNHARPLIIDPVLIYSTYLGGKNRLIDQYDYLGDSGNAITVDAAGEAYITGSTYSPNFPTTTDIYQTQNKAYKNISSNAFVSKFNAAGTALLFSTYLGGTGDAPYQGDSGQAIAVDASGDIYVAGNTYSSDFPVTSHALQKTNTNTYTGSPISYGETGFITRLNSRGSGLVYSTYFGGANNNGYPAGQSLTSLAIDASANAYVTGGTNSTTFPVTPGVFQPTLRATSQNAYISKLNPTGSALVYSTYLGGSSSPHASWPETGNAIAIDSAGDAYVAGSTSSPDFPVTADAYQTTFRGSANGTPNAFLTKLSPDGSTQLFSTFLGGTGQPTNSYYYTPFRGDAATTLAVGADGSVYVAGRTASFDFPVLGGLGFTANGITYASTSFLTKFTADGSSLVYSSYFGGLVASISAMALDSQENVYLTGNAGGGFFPLSTDAVLPSAPYNHDTFFLAKVNAAGTALNYSSSFGGSEIDLASAIALDPQDNAYITGSTNSVDFPTTPGAYQTVNHIPVDGNGSNAFVAAFALGQETTDQYLVSPAIGASATQVSLGSPVTFTVHVNSNAPTPATGSVTLNGLTTPAPVVALDNTGSAKWTSSTIPAGFYQVTASYPGDATHLTSFYPAASTANLRVLGPPASITNITGFNYTLVYGQFPNVPIYLRVQDSGGGTLSGITVRFSGTGFTFSSPTAVTDASGVATVNFTATRAGSLNIVATADGLSTPLLIPVTITPAPLTVQLLDHLRHYGAPNPDLTYKLLGLLNADVITATATTTATVTSPVGNYPITGTAGGPNASNYNITVAPATLTINKAPLYLTAKNVSVTYGQTPSPLSAYLLTGFLNGDTAAVVSGEPELSNTVTSTTPVGFYPTTIGIGTLTAQNYSIAINTSGRGSIQVTKAPLHIHPASFTIHAGDAIPPLTYILTGFVNGDTQATATTGAASITTTAPTPTKFGNYYIVGAPGSLQAGNYYFLSYVQDYGFLTVLR
jgi:hypothetical protein